MRPEIIFNMMDNYTVAPIQYMNWVPRAIVSYPVFKEDYLYRTKHGTKQEEQLANNIKKLIENPLDIYEMKCGTCEEAQNYWLERISSTSVQLLQQIDYLLNLKNNSHFTIVCPDSFISPWNIRHFVDFLVAVTINKNLQIEYISFREEAFHALRMWRAFADNFVNISYEINGQKYAEILGNTSSFPKEFECGLDEEIFIRACYHVRKLGIKDCW